MQVMPTITHNERTIPQVPTELSLLDKIGHWKVRCNIARMTFEVEPGIYAVGNPNGDSHVLVTANYRLTFDQLRRELGGLDAWILVLDTKAINVWCAAGKGTFGTDELIHKIETVALNEIVNHRKLILPQLGAVGVAAHEVKKRSGFSVIYGPIRASDIIQFLDADCKATQQMRQVRFSFYNRLVLAPVEFVMGLRHYLLFAVPLLILSGLSRKGYSLDLVLTNGLRSLLALFIAYLGGSILGPMLLPWLPGRSFAFKGFVAGLILALLAVAADLTGPLIETVAWFFLFATIGSFGTMNFTGASTYTSLSGVKKEMRIAVPLQLIAVVIGLALWLLARFL